MRVAKGSLLLALLLGSACAGKPEPPKSTPPPAPAPAPQAEATAKPTPLPQAQPLRIAFETPPEFVAPPLGKLRRGINLGNGFDAPSIGAWGVVLSEQHFEQAARAGLDHVRLPVRFSAYAKAEPPFTLDEEFLKKVDWAIEQALSRKLGIIVDLHHYEALMDNPDAHRERTLAIWEQVAQRYASQPSDVLFELVNEPCKKLDVAKNNELSRALIATIRRSNPTRTLIVDSYFWAAADKLASLDLPADPNVAVSFHMYQPILFTHQGAEWMDPEFQSRGIVFPGPGPVPAVPVAAAERTPWVRDWLTAYDTQPASTNPSGVQAVAREFDFATRFAKQSGRAVYLGEFGAVDLADATSRENYIRLVRREAERRGFAWAVWDDGGRNQAMDVRTGTWKETVARALFTDQPGEPLPDLGGSGR
jgi:endoglucanase